MSDDIFKALTNDSELNELLDKRIEEINFHNNLGLHRLTDDKLKEYIDFSLFE